MRADLTYSNPKACKSRPFGYLTALLHLQPHMLANGKRSLCAWSTAGCRAACLNESGHAGIEDPRVHGALNSCQLARRDRSLSYIRDPQGFAEALGHSLDRHIAKAARANLLPAARLNATSDVPWEAVAPQLFKRACTFYDYTKSYDRALAWARGGLPKNYHLTYSRSEQDNTTQIGAMLSEGLTVACVYHGNAGRQLLEGWGTYGNGVTDGDQHDLRFLDPPGSLVALRAKGKAKHDTSGFVVR